MKELKIDFWCFSSTEFRGCFNEPVYNEYTSLENKDVEPVELVQMNIYQSNTYRKDLGWLCFNNEPRAQERQQVKDQQLCISIFVAYLTIPSSN